jgi:hypothetical protein
MNSSETNPLSTNQTLLKTLAFITIYLLLRFAGGGFGEKILYPINMLVTFLHELGHATGALLSGGKMKSMDINLDGSGLTTTLGGSTAITLVSGYIGSAILHRRKAATFSARNPRSPSQSNGFCRCFLVHRLAFDCYFTPFRRPTLFYFTARSLGRNSAHVLRRCECHVHYSRFQPRAKLRFSPF